MAILFLYVFFVAFYFFTKIVKGLLLGFPPVYRFS